MNAGHANHLPIKVSTSIAVGVTLALNGFASSTWISRIPATRDRLVAEPATLGLMLLMTGIGAISFMPLAGRLATKYGSRPVLIGSTLLAAPLMILAAVTPTPVTTGMAMFALGACLGAADVVINVQGSFIDRVLDRDYMPRYHVGWSLGAITGATLGAIASRFEWPLWQHFALAGVIAAAGTTYCAVKWYVDDREPVHDSTSETEKPKTLLRDRRILIIGIIVLAAVFLEGSAGDWLALFLHDVRGTTQSFAAIGYATFALAMTLVRAAGTPVIARWGRVRVIRVAGFLAFIGVVLVLTVPVTAAALIGILLWGIGTGLVYPAGMSAAGETPGRSAQAIALVSLIGYSGFLIGPPIIGLIAQHTGLQSALWVVAPGAIAIAVLAPVVAHLVTTAHEPLPETKPN